MLHIALSNLCHSRAVCTLSHLKFGVRNVRAHTHSLSSVYLEVQIDRLPCSLNRNAHSNARVEEPEQQTSDCQCCFALSLLCSTGQLNNVNWDIRCTVHKHFLCVTSIFPSLEALCCLGVGLSLVLKPPCQFWGHFYLLC